MTAAASGPLRRSLLAWFDAHRRQLPWRGTRDPYAIWLSEVMLQQTQVSTVIPYYQRFLARFPDVESLARAPLDQVLASWKGLGYYRRARGLHLAALEVVARHGGTLPSTVEELRELPGFGRYTAGAVASIAFGVRAPLVDGNVARVLSRLFLVEGAPGDRAREARLWELAEQLVQAPRPGDWNQALMELGALVCRADTPDCPACPVREHCAALERGRVGELPPARKRAPRAALRLALAVWRHHGKVLLGRRADEGLFGGLWELPAARLGPSDGLTPLRTLLGRSVRLGPAMAEVKRTLTHRDLTLRLYPVEAGKRPRALAGYRDHGWFKPDELAKLGVATAMQKALDAAGLVPAPRRTRR